jgi:hypothetical protein
MGRPVVVDRNADHNKAQKYKLAFEKAGGVCVIRPVANRLSLTVETEVVPEVRAPKSAPLLHVEFHGSVLGLFGFYILFSILSSNVLLLPIGLYLILSWFGENTRLSDGSPVRFKGTIGQGYMGLLKFFGVMILFGVVGAAGSFLVSFLAPVTVVGVVVGGVVIIGLFFVMFFILFRVTRWIVESYEFRDSGPLLFQGTFGGYLGWMSLYFLPFVMAATLIAPLVPFSSIPELNAPVSFQTKLPIVIFFALLFGVVFLYFPWWISRFWAWLINNVRSSAGWSLSWEMPIMNVYGKLVPAMIGALLIIPIPWIMKSVVSWFINDIVVKRK